jgi:FkbM family methyltransferase
MKITKLLKRGFKMFGFDLVRLNGGLGHGTFENELLKIIKSIGVDLIFDIGANKGQFGKMMYSYGYSNTMLSFEPLTKMHRLLSKVADSNSNWHIYERCCIGDKEDQTIINISNLVGNSSILPIKSTKFNVDQSHFVGAENVKQIALSSLNEHALVIAATSIFVKMDVQGFEHVILNGLKDINYEIAGFYIELSLIKLYDKQEDYLYICNQLKTLGYDLVYVIPESIRSGRMIQFNAVFLHNSLSYN